MPHAGTRRDSTRCARALHGRAPSPAAAGRPTSAFAPPALKAAIMCLFGSGSRLLSQEAFMRRKTALWFFAVCGFFGLAAPARADVVTEWNELAFRLALIG